MQRCLAHCRRRQFVATLCTLGILTFASLGTMLALAEEPLIAEDNSADAETQAELREALELKVRLNYENTPLAEALQNLENLCNVQFDYTDKARDMVKSDPRITFRLDKPTSLDKALRGMLTLHQLAYVIEGDRLLIVQATPNEPIVATSDRDWVARVIDHENASIHLLVLATNPSKSIPLDITVQNQGRLPLEIGVTGLSIDCKVTLTSDDGDIMPYTRSGSHFYNNREGFGAYAIPKLKYNEAHHWRVNLAELFEPLAPGIYWLSFEADTLLWDEEKRGFAQPLSFRTDRLKVVIEK